MRDLTTYLPVCVLGIVVHAATRAPESLARAERDAGPPVGQYVEARTASVFAGACHYGSEYTTRGREALLVWHFERGSWRGVDLCGTNVALAVSGEENLDEAAGARHSILYTDGKDAPERRAAAADFVRTRCRELAGDVRAVKCVDLTFAFDDESYTARAPGLFELRGSKLENRACCAMPYDVWYTPFVDLAHPVVGCNSIFQFEDRALGPIWKRAGQNESFVGRFDLSAPAGLESPPAEPSRGDPASACASKPALVPPALAHAQGPAQGKEVRH